MEKVLKAANNLFENGFWEALAASALIAAAAWIFLKIMNGAFTRRVLAHGHLDATQAAFLRRVLGAGVFIAAAMLILLQVKPLRGVATSLLASSGVLAVIIGFAAQQAMANVIGGFFLSAFKTVALGDRVRLSEKDIEGFVEDISLRHTIIRTFTNTRVIVPNSLMNSAVIENYRYEEEKICRFLDVGIAYASDVDRALGILRTEARAHRDYFDNRTEEEKRRGVPEVVVRVTGLGNNAVTLRAYIWAKDAGTGWVMLCDLLYTVKKRFDEAGIEFPRLPGGIN